MDDTVAGQSSEDEVSWLQQQRAGVIAYLNKEGVKHGEVGSGPAWHVYPYLAIFAIESVIAPDMVGWWVISGDVPTDYVSSKGAEHPRDAMRLFASRWAAISTDMLRGEAHSGFVIGTADQRPHLGALLHRRAQLLGQWADDDSVWNDGSNID